MKKNVRKALIGVVKLNKKNIVVLAILFIANTVALNLEYSKELKKRGWKFSFRDFKWHKETCILFKTFEESEAKEIRDKLKLKYGLIGCLVSSVLKLFEVIDVY